MGLRDFTDSRGTVWKVWDVTPDQLDRRTAAEDYMADWQDGWLCFECGEERRRLARYPTQWMDLPDTELEQLLGSAQAVRRRHAGETTGEFSRRPEPTPPGGSPHAAGRRRVVDEHGRAFDVAVQRVAGERSASGKGANAPASVLRFTCGNLMLDLERWPEDWQRLSDEQLLALLEHARPASRDAAAEARAHRRQSDASS
jgi:hypothetical protein